MQCISLDTAVSCNLTHVTHVTHEFESAPVHLQTGSTWVLLVPIESVYKQSRGARRLISYPPYNRYVYIYIDIDDIDRDIDNIDIDILYYDILCIVADIAPSHTGQHGGPLGVILPWLLARCASKLTCKLGTSSCWHIYVKIMSSETYYW